MRFDSPRVIGLVASGLVLAGWLLGSTLSPPVATTQGRETARTSARPAPVMIVPLRDFDAAAAPGPPRRRPAIHSRSGACPTPTTAAADAVRRTDDRARAAGRRRRGAGRRT